jgi:hypothetical protein
VFGPTGLLLAIMIFSAGLSLHKRRASSRKFIRSVGIWAIVHNIVVVYAVLACATLDSSTRTAWSDFALQNGFGWVAIAYATVSFAHAFTLLAAIREHERAEREAIEQSEDLEHPVADPLSAL